MSTPAAGAAGAGPRPRSAWAIGALAGLALAGSAHAGVARDADLSTGAVPPTPWTVEVPRTQPIRLQRSFVERTPDASARGGFLQIQQGVNPWAKLLLYVGTHLVANAVEKGNKAAADEVLVATDQALGGGAVAVAEAASARQLGSQEDANLALRPYAEALGGTSLHDLLAADERGLQQRGLRLSAGGAVSSAQQPVIHIAPKMVFAADQRSMSVDTLVGFGALESGAPGTEKRALRVQVYSAAHEGLDASDHWLRDGARALRTTFSTLVVEAIDLARRRHGASSPAQASASASASAAQRTYRFRLGAENHYLRGSLADASCERVVIDTLHGPIVSLPAASLRVKDAVPERGGHGR